ncbi:MAG: hypothetical protein NUV65_04420 [Candidatus Roizmanbacteria bacterium]|nr:hypothetical protein [Candidatus Roizmanbacteria bacterium]
MKKYFIVSIVGASIYFLINVLLFMNFPQIWPDETWYADVAYNLLHHTVYGTSLLGNVLSSNTVITMYPPLLFHIYAALYKLFGFGPYVQRTFAFIASLGVLYVSIIYLGKKIFKFSPLSLSLLALFFFTNFTFMRASHFGRPEIYILFLHSIAYTLILGTKKWWRYSIAGLSIGLSVLLQPYGIIGGFVIGIYMLINIKNKKSLLTSILLFAIPIAICILWWFSVLHFDFEIFSKGMHIQTLRKQLETNLFYQITHDSDRMRAYVQLSLVLGSILVLVFALLEPIAVHPFIVVGLIVSWVFILVGKQFWYEVYVVPFLLLGYGSILSEKIQKKSKNFLQILSVFALMSLASIVLVWRTIGQYGGSSFSYAVYTESVARSIPSHSTVLISSIPDPYFALKKDPTINIYQFLGLPGFKEIYIQMLDDSDYVIYNGSYDYVYGDFLPQYLEKNQKETLSIYNGPDQYQGVVVKLVPKNKRKKI